jgi:hypothetical protein
MAGIGTMTDTTEFNSRMDTLHTALDAVREWPIATKELQRIKDNIAAAGQKSSDIDKALEQKTQALTALKEETDNTKAEKV